jgi:nicotinate-nucleotide adenylyltransferase
MKSIALFGGSFDPPHLGHLEVVDRALEQLDIEKLIVLPAYLNPFKTTSVAPASLRLKWLQRIFKDYPDVEVSSFEIDHNRSVATIESVRYFKSLQSAHLFLIIGADNLESLEQWQHFDELKDLVTFVVAHRDAITIPSHYIDLHVDAPVSSTVLRQKMNHTLIPQSVSDEISQYYKEKNGKQN